MRGGDRKAEQRREDHRGASAGRDRNQENRRSCQRVRDKPFAREGCYKRLCKKDGLHATYERSNRSDRNCLFITGNVCPIERSYALEIVVRTIGVGDK